MWRYAVVVGVLAGGGALGWALASSSPPPPVRADAPVVASTIPGPKRNAAPVADETSVGSAADAELGVTRILAEDPGRLRQRFDSLRWSESQPAELAALARDIDAALPQLVGQGTVDAGDALMLKADVLDVLELDPMLRRERLRDWWKSHPLASRPLAPGDARIAEEERRELAALDEWQAQSSEDRDAGELAEKLQDMRAVLSARTH